MQVSDRTVEVPVVVQWDGTSWSIVPSPNPNKNTPQQSAQLEGIVAISANDIWAVGFNGTVTLTEHWDGMNWKIVASPSPGQNNQLLGVAAASDGTVAAVGWQFSSTTGMTPLILQNAASAPKTWMTSAALAATIPVPPDALSPATRDIGKSLGARQPPPAIYSTPPANPPASWRRIGLTRRRARALAVTRLGIV